jgi:hypothetical protein
LGDFRILGDCLLWPVFEITEVAQKCRPMFSTLKVMHQFRQKMGWAKFWAIFSQNHPVTLLAVEILNT